MSSTYGSRSVPFTLRVFRRMFSITGNITPRLAGRLALQLFCTPLKRTVSDFSKSALPAPETLDVAYKGGTIRAYQWGAGPTVMFVHGWESNAARFSRFVQPLVNNGFRVVLVDGHAHGASSGRYTNYLRYTDALYAVMQQLGDLHGIVGHSFGAGATMVLLDRHPDIQVKRVVLIASVNHLVEMMSIFAQMVHLPARAFEAMQRHLRQLASSELSAFDADRIASTRTEAALIIHDHQDIIMSIENARLIAGAWAGAQLIETDGLGHRRILKNQQVIEQLTQFMGATVVVPAEGVATPQV